MAYFIFNNKTDQTEISVYRIAENESDLNNFNIIKSEYYIKEDSQENFNAVKYGQKRTPIYNINTNSITFEDIGNNIFTRKEELQLYVEDLKTRIKDYLDNNKTHISFNIWNNYYNQLNNLNLDSITYPLEKTLEQYFNDLGQSSLHPLQLP